MKTEYCKRWFLYILLTAMIFACSDSQAVATSTNIPATAAPTITPLPPTATIAPTATAIPLAWKQIYDGQGFERDTVTAFATDKTDPNVIYAGMKNTGVYKTIDSGLSWHPAYQGLVSMQVESLLIDSQNPRILYASTLGGAFKTEDGGENWLRAGDGTYLLMDLQNNSHLYARDENGIYETTDQGNNWTNIYTLKKDCPDDIQSWAIHPADWNMLFIGGGETCAGVYQSSDSGRSWKLIGMKDEPNLDALTIGLDKQGNYFIHTCNGTPASDPDTIYCTYEGGGLWYIQGKGSAGQRMGLERFDLTAIHIDRPNGMDRIIVGGTRHYSHPDDGILISTDGGISWNNRDNGIGGLRSELKIDPADSTRMYLATYTKLGQYGYGCILYRSPDNGKNWISSRTASWCGPAFGADNVLYLMEQFALQMSSNGGETWQWGQSGHDQYYWDGAYKFALPSYHRGESSESVSANLYIVGLVYDIGNTIYYSTGSGWQKSSGSEGLRDARLFYTDQSKMIYAIGRYHQSYSTDNGKTWQNCGENVTASRSDSRLALDLGGSRLYLAMPGQGVMVSTDSCGSWQPSNNGLSNLFVNTLAIDPKDSNTIYAGTDGGAYISYDSGATWGQVNDGLLGATVVYSIAVDKDSNVYAATPYGVFKLEGK